MNRQSHAWPENVNVNGFPAQLIKKLTILFLPAEIIGKVDTPQFPIKITGKKKVPGFPTKKTGQKLNPGFPTKITEKLWYSRVSRQDYREIIRFPGFPPRLPRNYKIPGFPRRVSGNGITGLFVKLYKDGILRAKSDNVLSTSISDHLER